MNIAVVGANGASGKVFINVALAAGHTIKAGVRNLASLQPTTGLTVTKCDATNIEEVRNLLIGVDAVASFIGHVKGSAPDMQTNSTKNLVTVMTEQGIARIVTITGTGVRFPGDKVTLIDWLLNTPFAIIARDRVQDGKGHVEVLKQSSLDWTVIRVLFLTNFAPEPFALRLNGPTKLIISREEAAQAVLQVLEHGSFIGQAPIIGHA